MGLGWQRLKRNKVGFISMWIVLAYLLVSIGGWFNLVGAHWTDEVGVPYAPPSWVNESRTTCCRRSRLPRPLPRPLSN
ncbi:N-terminal TM domain of oligopeptide transport permease C [Chromobacterium violaceum]|uniref:N-terminal TM domain of oligopeptide transport permease C n=1 Tax=Chromobacterium violaceum TaxID=536 RepID=A0A3S4HQQ0_CHRVL|nr:N-terminal TM domain of oligopeptide transport permease C [Chromobacterium violaceum]